MKELFLLQSEFHTLRSQAHESVGEEERLAFVGLFRCFLLLQRLLVNYWRWFEHTCVAICIDLMKHGALLLDYFCEDLATYSCFWHCLSRNLSGIKGIRIVFLFSLFY